MKIIKDLIRKYRLSIIIGAIGIVVALLIIFIPGQNGTVTNIDLSEYSSISSICELATLKSYYHNVVMFEQNPSGRDKFFNDVMFWPFGELTKTGYKQFWMEYSGIVETGIDAGQIQINSPDSKGVVQAYVPDAKVINVYADENSMSEPISEKGLFTTITGKDQSNAFSEAQSEMRLEAENDQSLLRRSKNNAKLLLERYIINTGKKMGKDYTVVWLDSPL